MKPIVGPNRGRAPKRYIVEHLPDGRYRVSSIVGGTVHRRVEAAEQWARKMAASADGQVELLHVDRSAERATPPS